MCKHRRGGNGADVLGHRLRETLPSLCLRGPPPRLPQPRHARLPAHPEADELVDETSEEAMDSETDPPIDEPTEEISENRTHYKNVMLAPRNTSKDNFVILSPNAQITGSVAEGNLRMVLFEGVSYSLDTQTERSSSLTFRRAEIDLLRVFQEKIIGEDTARDDYRSYTALELRNYVKKMEQSPKKNPDFLKASYLYYSRFANPFIVFAFTFFGIIMGIQEQRHGKNRGYLGSILVIISCFVIMVSFRWLAENAHIPPVLASWLPQALVLLFGGFCIFQKSRLPPSEPILAFKNFPRLPLNLIKKANK